MIILTIHPAVQVLARGTSKQTCRQAAFQKPLSYSQVPKNVKILQTLAIEFLSITVLSS
jgi:hypothetical protein